MTGDLDTQSGVSGIAKSKDGQYLPYKIDWRFMPDPILLLKDLVRPHLVVLNLAVARSRLLGPFWRATLGRGTAEAIRNAGKLFIHIPKTGGTSISKCLYGRNLPHYTADFYQDVFPELLSSVPSFGVIRDPIERILSSYSFIKAGGTEIMATSRYAKLLVEKAGDFDRFVDELYRQPERSHVFEVLEQQITYVTSGGKFLVDYLFTLDRNYGFSPALSSLIDTSEIPHINATVRTPVAISPESERKIRHLYQSDFALFEALNNSPTAKTGELTSFKGRSTGL